MVERKIFNKHNIIFRKNINFDFVIAVYLMILNFDFVIIIYLIISL